MLTTADYIPMNRDIRRWLRKVVNGIVQDMHAKGVRHRSRSRSERAAFLLVGSALKLRFGAPERAAIKFPMHLIFVKYGVGRGRAKGSGKEIPKDIIDNILDKHLDELADLVTEHYADLVVNNIFIDKSRRATRSGA